MKGGRRRRHGTKMGGRQGHEEATGRGEETRKRAKMSPDEKEKRRDGRR